MLRDIEKVARVALQACPTPAKAKISAKNAISNDNGHPAVDADEIHPAGIPVAGPEELHRLYAALDLVTPTLNPRTARLLDSSIRKMARKLMEEAGEVAIEVVRRRRPGTIRESADLLYHLVVLWHAAGIQPADVWEEMRSRAQNLGIAEKLPKAPDKVLSKLQQYQDAAERQIR